MNLRGPKPEEDIYINVIPFIDVLLVLLIFFLLSTTFLQRSEIQLRLPQASQDVPPKEMEQVKILIDAQGRYFVNGQALVNSQSATIKQAIQEAAAHLSGPNIVISADASTSHQAVVTAMDAVRQLGFTRLTIATETKRDDPAGQGAPADGATP